jgi:nucleoid-associated protein YgaU
MNHRGLLLFFLILTTGTLVAAQEADVPDPNADTASADTADTVTAVPTSSYAHNEFQLLSRRYVTWASQAIDEGDYDAAIEYAALAEENALLSEDYVRTMLRRDVAAQKIARASTRLSWADKSGAAAADEAAVASARIALADAHTAFTAADYEIASDHAQKALDALAGLTAPDNDRAPWRPGDPGLPKYYVVRLWDKTGDCFWNIAAKPFVYNNPWSWRDLYAANRTKTQVPGNANRIAPGVILEIPNRTGEHRRGTYDSGLT